MIEDVKVVASVTLSEEPAPDEARQAMARAYARVQRWLFLVELGISLLLMVGFLLSGASKYLKVLLIAIGITGPWVLVGTYAGLLFSGYMVLLLPLSWWRGYVLPHRYGLSTQTLKGWITDELKVLGLGLALGVPVAELAYWLLRTYPDRWWIWTAASLIVMSVTLGFLVPVVILPIFYKLVPLEDAELVDRIRCLGERTETRIAGVYTINLSSRTTAANAMVMGMGATKRIALGDTLYAEYTSDEIETILAHELGHQIHRDMELSVVVQSLLLVGSFYLAQQFLQWGIVHFGFEGPGDIAASPLLALAMVLFSFIFLPLENGYSRWRERLADRFALQVTQKPRAFRDAMIHLADQNLAEFDPPRWVVWLLYDHPPIRQRVEMAQRWSSTEQI